MTSVARIKRKGGEIVTDCEVYIGRRMTMGGWDLQQSKWANPFSVREYGREEALRKYREYILSRDDLIADLPSLKGKVLGCWCAPEKCHGNILADFVDGKDPEIMMIQLLKE